MFGKQFVPWYCKAYSTAPFFDYINNPIFQELPLEKDYLAVSLTKDFTSIYEIAQTTQTTTKKKLAGTAQYKR